MRPISDRIRRIHLLSIVAIAGCASSATDLVAPGVASQASVTSNSLTANSLTSNSLTANSVTANSLTANSLTANSLTSNELTAEALKDPSARLFLKYLYIVALLPEHCDSYDFADPQTGQRPAVFCGNLGLCVRWRFRGIQDDVDCQEWVSAGILAHVNALGVSVPFSARGPTPTLLVVSGLEAEAYRFREGAFWGNIFKEPREMYAATDVRNVEIAKLNQRLCAQSGTGETQCGIEVVGPVDSASVSGDFARGWACELTQSTLTWTYALNDPNNILNVSPSNIDDLHLTLDQVVSLCHPYLTTSSALPTPTEVAATQPRAVTSYLTEAGLKLMYGCSPTMFPAPTGACAATGGGGCDHPGDDCCQDADGTRYCRDWVRSSGSVVPQACVNDQVAAGGEARQTCTPRP